MVKIPFLIVRKITNTPVLFNPSVLMIAPASVVNTFVKPLKGCKQYFLQQSQSCCVVPVLVVSKSNLTDRLKTLLRVNTYYKLPIMVIGNSISVQTAAAITAANFLTKTQPQLYGR
jgi:hypothetical protein